MGGKGVRSFSDLKGKKLSVDALTTGFAFVLRALLEKNGIAESEVSFERAGGLVERFPKLLDGSHAATVVLTPFDLIAQAKGHVQLARAGEQLGAYQGVVGAAVHPQNVLNHWGLDVGSKEEVDRVHKEAIKNKDKYKIRQVLPVVDQHGVYSFYLEDLDHNWWEVQYYPGFQNEDLFDFGDRFSMDDGAEVGELKELNIKTTA
jgi:hypothetical protein